jgi:hypothetical protein
VVGRLEHMFVVDELLGVDPDSLSDSELAEAMVELRRAQARLAAATVRLTAVFDTRRVWAADGSRSAGAWLAHRCRLPAGHMRAEVRLGRRLGHMEATAAAFGLHRRWGWGPHRRGTLDGDVRRPRGCTGEDGPAVGTAPRALPDVSSTEGPPAARSSMASNATPPPTRLPGGWTCGKAWVAAACCTAR